MLKTQRWSLRLGALAGLLDALWSSQALQIERYTNTASNVEVSGLIVWIYLHLPAALLASWSAELLSLNPVDPSAPFPPSVLLLLGVLGAAQAVLIGAGLGTLLDRRART